MEYIIPIVVGLVCLAAGCFIGFAYRKNIAEGKTMRAEEAVKKMLEDAQKRAETIKKETVLEAKEEVLRIKNEQDQEHKQRWNELQRTESRLVQREETLEKKLSNCEQREEKLTKREKDIQATETKAQELLANRQAELEAVARMTAEEAKQELVSGIEREAKHEAAAMVREIEAQAKEDADKRARGIVSMAIQRCASDQVAEAVVSIVPLPNDEMKGRIIGREGRNIRAIENATGVDLIIDDTPEVVILSAFDPVRREIARIALEKLVVDERIHPAHIEDTVRKAKREVDVAIHDAGERAVFDTNVHGVHNEILKLLGRLRYRTSYGQNVLQHSIEVAHLAGMMAAEIGANVTLAKRCGLLHDIGKAIDHEVEGTHAQLGADMAKRYNESAVVVNAIASHHNDIEPTTIEAILVQAADAISAARPGARRETLQTYIKRLEKLEEIANSFDGVDKSYAIQAGREIRIIVKPDKINDEGTFVLARDIVKRIESELEYPGQIRVNVIRETRATEIAK